MPMFSDSPREQKIMAWRTLGRSGRCWIFRQATAKCINFRRKCCPFLWEQKESATALPSG